VARKAHAPCGLVVSAHASPTPETRFAIGDRGEGVQEIPGRACQPVEPGHHQHIAAVDSLERLAELGAVGLRAARCLTEHLFASSLGELADLCVHALTVG
jgi:hypothetical protein